MLVGGWRESTGLRVVVGARLCRRCRQGTSRPRFHWRCARASRRKRSRRVSSAGLRLYHTSDCRGVEIGGAAKNVLAIAAGIVAGMGLGESARAAMIARGFAELRRFASAFGANPETLMGLSGLGDLLLTASSPQSRNFSLGLRAGCREALREAMGAQKTGVQTGRGRVYSEILVKMAHDRDVDMPIVQAVTRVIDGQISVMDAVRDLMARPLRCE